MNGGFLVPLAAPRRNRLVDQVITSMRQMIADGEWPVGERIPPEPELVASLGVGRNTVREAVGALAHSGVFEVRQGDGTYVSAPSEMSGVVRRRLAAADVRYAIEVRRAYELEAARLAATRRTAADLRKLDKAYAARERAWDAGDADHFVATDAAFHLAIVEAAHNPVLTELYVAFADSVHASLAARIGTRLEPAEYIDHGALLEAIRAQDADAAIRETACFLHE